MRTKMERNISKVFLELYKEKEYKRITVKEICAKADVSRATFYTYYEDISSLLHEIETRILYEVGELIKTWKYFKVKNTQVSELYPLYLDVYRYVNNNCLEFQALFGPYGSHKFILQYHNMVKDSYYNKIRAELPNVQQADMMASFLAGSVIYASQNFITTSEHITPEEIALMASKIVLSIFQIEKG